MRSAFRIAVLSVWVLSGGCTGGVADPDAMPSLDGGDAAQALTDAGPWPDSVLPDGRVVGGPYATSVVSFMPGAGAGFGAQGLPGVVLGPPVGGGSARGGTDVLSLGMGGRICLRFDDVEIVDGPGPDFLVFENPFFIGGDPNQIYDELGEVSVSDDGVTFQTFVCTRTGPPYTGCAGWNPVYSTPSNGIPPDAIPQAGGDPFDLADVGLTRARVVCIHDLGTQAGAAPTEGFDLDALAAVHWE